MMSILRWRFRVIEILDRCVSKYRIRLIILCGSIFRKFLIISSQLLIMEQKENLIQKLSYEFALKSIQLYQNISESRKEFILSKQFLRSATSIGANIEEAIAWQSKKDFISKLSIAQKESRESYYWIRLLHDSWYISDNEFHIFESDILSIIRVLTKILVTTKNAENYSE